MKRPGLSRAFGEVVLIVVGILLALSLDAAWQSRLDRQAERALLTALRDEFVENAGSLARWRGLHDDIVVSSEALIRRLEGATDGSLVAVPDSLLGDMGRTPTYTPSLNSMDAAINSGRLSLIRSAEIQTALANWTRLLADAQEEETRSADLVYSHVLPHLGGAADLGPALRRLTEDVARVMAGTPREPWPTTSAELRVSRALVNLLWVRYRLASSAATELGILEEELGRMLELLERELR